MLWIKVAEAYQFLARGVRHGGGSNKHIEVIPSQFYILSELSEWLIHNLSSQDGKILPAVSLKFQLLILAKFPLLRCFF